MGRRKRLRTTSTVDDHLEAQSHQQHSQGEDQTVDHESTDNIVVEQQISQEQEGIFSNFNTILSQALSYWYFPFHMCPSICFPF